jgi:Ni/Fe-hydrogenase subunit HybB-like protein
MNGGVNNRVVPIVAKAVIGAIAITGLVAITYRFAAGLGATTNLSDNWPWGLWIAFDLLCGVALASGGFTTAAAVYVLGREKYKPLARPAILTAFLGYVLVIIALLVDLGQPQRMIHMIWMWNPDSVLFEVGWCVLLYTTVLALEFAPVILERWKMHRAIAVIHKIQIPLVIIGIGLSTLHQSSLGSLFLAAAHRLDPLWLTPMLPALFFLSAVCAGLAMVIFESTVSSKIMRRSAENDALNGFSAALPWVLGVYLWLKLMDLTIAGEMGQLFKGTTASNMFLVEIVAGVIAPMVLFMFRRVRRNEYMRLVAAMLVIGGTMGNRFNVALVGMKDPQGTTYFPSWMELAATAGIVALGMIVFGLAVRFLRVFPDRAEEHHA